MFSFRFTMWSEAPWSWTYTWELWEWLGWVPCGTDRHCSLEEDHHRTRVQQHDHSYCKWSWSSSSGCPSSWGSRRRVWSCPLSRTGTWTCRPMRKKACLCCQPRSRNLMGRVELRSDWGLSHTPCSCRWNWKPLIWVSMSSDCCWRWQSEKVFVYQMEGLSLQVTRQEFSTRQKTRRLVWHVTPKFQRFGLIWVASSIELAQLPGPQ